MSIKKTADVDTPHATFLTPDGAFEFRVLKTYKAPKGEAKDPYARWFLASRSPLTHGSWELGDGYCAEIKSVARMVQATEEWLDAYDPLTLEAR